MSFSARRALFSEHSYISTDSSPDDATSKRQKVTGALPAFPPLENSPSQELHRGVLAIDPQVLRRDLRVFVSNGTIGELCALFRSQPIFRSNIPDEEWAFLFELAANHFTNMEVINELTKYSNLSPSSRLEILLKNAIQFKQGDLIVKLFEEANRSEDFSHHFDIFAKQCSLETLVDVRIVLEPEVTDNLLRSLANCNRPFHKRLCEWVMATQRCSAAVWVDTIEKCNSAKSENMVMELLRGAAKNQRLFPSAKFPMDIRKLILSEYQNLNSDIIKLLPILLEIPGDHSQAWEELIVWAVESNKIRLAHLLTEEGIVEKISFSNRLNVCQAFVEAGAFGFASTLLDRKSLSQIDPQKLQNLQIALQSPPKDKISDHWRYLYSLVSQTIRGNA